jgi:hypothetical protein
MRLIIDHTEEFFLTGPGFPVRAWRGKTASGLNVIAFIAAIAVTEDGDHAEFERELKAIPGPNTARVAINPSFTCPTCGVTSHNPNDVEMQYCVCCHVFHGDGEQP